MHRLTFVLLILLLSTPTASADSVRLWLARYCVNEAGWQIDKPWGQTSHKYDCGAMARSLRNNFRRARIETWMIRRYGGRVFDRNRPNRQYIPFLRPSPRVPRGWRRANWSGLHYQRFVHIYKLAGRLLHQSLPIPSDCNPHHWGARSLNRRARRMGWIRQNCGATLNVFWRVPRRQIWYGV